MQFANIFDKVEHLDADKRESLIAVCKEMGLSAEATEGVEQAARLLREFELYGKPNILSPAARIANFRKIAELSRSLQGAISKLETLDHLAMHIHIEKLGLPNGAQLPEVVPAPGFVQYLRYALVALDATASHMCSLPENAVKKGGRPRSRHLYCLYLDWVLGSVENEGLTCGRGGPFERICDAVFVAAGVHAKAEGALQYFLEEKAHEAKKQESTCPDCW